MDLILIDGSRPLLGEGVPNGEVGEVLKSAPCDVGVLVAKERESVLPGPDAPVIVPFGGAEHDWAALELGAWIAAATDAPLRLMGAAGETEERTRVTRMLGDAGLLVQQYAGITAEPLVTEEGGEAVLEAAAGAGPADDRPLRALAGRGPGPDALGDRPRGAGAGAVREARHPAGRARPAPRT